MKVLIVEDSLYKLDEEERLLRRLGYMLFMCNGSNRTNLKR